MADGGGESSNGRYVVAGLLGFLLVVAVGHLYLISGLTTRYLGLPLWVLVELVVVFGMMLVAWAAVRVLVRTRGGAA